MTRETQAEYRGWLRFCEEARKVGIDPNDKKFNKMFRAAALWGETLVAFRLTQTPTQRVGALAQATERLEKASNG